MLCFEEIGHRDIISKFLNQIILQFNKLLNIIYKILIKYFFKVCSLSCIVLSQHSAKKFARDFCKDRRKFACFRTLGRKWAGLIIKILKNRKFGTVHIHSSYRSVGPPPPPPTPRTEFAVTPHGAHLQWRL